MTTVRFAALLLPTLLPAQYFQVASGFVPPAVPEAVVYDPGRDRVVAFLGDTSAFPGTATWEHDGLAWSPVATATQPGPRVQPAMAFDGGRTLVYGGATPFGTPGGALADFWAFDGTTWTQPPVGAIHPGKRAWSAMAYDPLRQRVVLFGGTDQLGNFPTDTWEWDGVGWTVHNVPGPAARVWHRMVFDEVRQRIVLCGGAFNPAFFADTWEWDGSSWAQTVMSQFPVTAQPALVFDRSTQRTLLFRGATNLGVTSAGETYAYDPTAGSWVAVANGNQLPFGAAIHGCYDGARNRTLLLPDPGFYPSSPLPTTLLYRDQGTGGASYTSFGQGCAIATGQVPTLAAAPGSSPALGTTFTVRVGPVGGALAAVLGVGWSRSSWAGQPLPLSLAPFGFAGCDLQVRPDALLPMTLQPAANAATASWPMPNAPALAGVVFFEQALLLAPAAPNGVGAVSNGAMGVVQ